MLATTKFVCLAYQDIRIKHKLAPQRVVDEQFTKMIRR